MSIGIKPTVDIVFKRIFGSPSESHLTLHFLNDLLPLVGRNPAESIVILNPFRLVDFRGEKEISVDVRAQDKAKRDFQIEMQIRGEDAPPSRMLDNWSRIYSGQVGRGGNYADHKPVIAIWIVVSTFFPEPQWLHCIRPIRDTGSNSFSEDFLIVIIELKKRAALPEIGRAHV